MCYNAYMRECKYCKQVKPLEQMVKDKNAREGRRNMCNSCNALRMKKYFKEHPEKYENNKNTPRAKKPNWKRHHLTQGQYSDLLAKHDGKCYVCLIREAEVIDHSHSCCTGTFSCGKCVRGILCHACNLAIGHLDDDIDRLQAAVVYLQRNRPLSLT